MPIEVGQTLMDKAFVWPMAFVASQAAIMAVAFLPARD
jgi:hypothetical protein